VRPQVLHPGAFADRGHLNGRISLVERLGTETVLNVDLTAGGRVIVSLDGDSSFDLGTEILLGFEPHRAHLFPSA
jgi:multiple sugar transport system ATP-binding protein